MSITIRKNNIQSLSEHFKNVLFYHSKCLDARTHSIRGILVIVMFIGGALHGIYFGHELTNEIPTLPMHLDKIFKSQWFIPALISLSAIGCFFASITHNPFGILNAIKTIKHNKDYFKENGYDISQIKSEEIWEGLFYQTPPRKTND